ncbi:lysosomal-associated transmembrane protein 4B [Anabrus simplex]|uniref:lysosomal-associated transmembrane protein 4B n=1 Tax=Anabrus simplex TaxID=316456 RepID=UPI0035A35391
MVVFNKFCCCCKLRTGTITLAWFGLIYEIFDLVGPVTLYANREYIFPSDEHRYNSGAHIAVSMSTPYYITLVVLKILCVLSMNYGATNGRRYFLLPWLIMDMILLSLWALTILIVGVVLMVAIGALGILLWIFGFPFIALGLYIWLCVFSCFQDMPNSGNCDETGLLLGYPTLVQNLLGRHQPANANIVEA